MTAFIKATILLLTALFVSFAPLAETVVKKGNKTITVMSLNIYGWKTMPQHSDDYAQLVNKHKVDVLGIQEGVEDWQLKHNELNNKLPTDYQRAITLAKSLGQCWQHKFQIFINHCQGNRFIECVVGQFSRPLNEQQLRLTLDHSQTRDNFRIVSEPTE